MSLALDFARFLNHFTCRIKSNNLSTILSPCGSLYISLDIEHVVVALVRMVHLQRLCRLAGMIPRWAVTWVASERWRDPGSERPLPTVIGVWLANDWDDVVDGSLKVAPSPDECGESRIGNVWTGTNSAGVYYMDPPIKPNYGECFSWYSSLEVDIGFLGYSGSTNGGWSYSNISPCDVAHSLYCIQQTLE